MEEQQNPLTYEIIKAAIVLQKPLLIIRMKKMGLIESDAGQQCGK